jgi:hypothetical protein
MTASPIGYATAVDARQLPFKDRRTSLRVMGIVLLVLGSLSGCIGILAPVGMAVSVILMKQANANRAARGATTAPALTAAPETMDIPTMAMAAGTYGLLAALLIWVGIGSVRVRRWVRPVIQVAGWTWLVTGLLSFLHWAVFGIDMNDIMTAGVQPGAPAPPRAVLYAITAFTAAFMFVAMVLFPALVLWVYLRNGVRDTLNYFDPRYAWTDRCPTPVLALAGWLAVGGLATAAYAFYAVFPVFGRYVTGAPAVAALLGVAGVYLWLAWGAYRVRTYAWWGTAVASTVWTGSMIWTFTRLGYDEFYRQAGYTPQQVDMMMRYSGQFEDSTVWMMALWSVGLVAYLLYVRKYFLAGPPPEPGAAPAQPEPLAAPASPAEA